ncbi:nephrin-like [Procambarus clarkii]|uniref:nephrin-like n=1 Tax=Procambarus clarkii TaxID=6728 RepID=UPI003744A3C5
MEKRGGGAEKEIEGVKEEGLRDPGRFFETYTKKEVRPYDKTVEITELEVPESPRAGDDVTLTCRFKLHGNGHNLYTVNWWRGKDQFYTYKGTNLDSKHAFTFRGIQVKEEESTRESVVLKNVSEDTSGVFKCEVMGEGPSFRTAVKTKVMNVIVPPRTVEVHSWADPDPPTYRAGETIQINCTARGAKPRAHIMWEINGRPVRDLNLVKYADFEDHRGRVTTTLGLRWMAPEYFLNNIARVTCRAAVAGHSTTASKDIYLDPASSAAFNHPYGSAGMSERFTHSSSLVGETEIGFKGQNT